ncbi:MAG: site-2 protease family protein [Acidimicrobiales bacterium]
MGPGLRRNQSLAVLLGIVLVYLVIRRHIINENDIILFAVIVPSIILHEVTHGVVALYFGDDTAKRAGRLTLNPLVHVDPFGTLILPAILTLVGFGAFGYAKPVPVNLARLRSPRNHGLLVSLAGPLTNIVLALIAGVILRSIDPTGAVTLFGNNLLNRILLFFGYANVLLAVFNLIPIPPLDGSAVIERMLPRSWWPSYLHFRQYAMVGLLVVVLVFPAVLNRIFTPAFNLWIHLLGW